MVKDDVCRADFQDGIFATWLDLVACYSRNARHEVGKRPFRALVNSFGGGAI